MSDQWSDPVCFDGDLDVPAACGLPEFSSPISATTAEYIFTQDWMVSRKAFQRTPLNTPHPSQSQVPDYSAYGLVEEGPRTDVGGGMVKWKRMYAIVPDSHDEFETYNYQFIGFRSLIVLDEFGAITPGSVFGRSRKSRIVTSRTRHDYFLIGAGGSYATAGEIPLFPETRYLANERAGSIVYVSPERQVHYPGDSDVEFIFDLSPGDIPQITFGTTPTRSAYGLWVTNARAQGWSALPVSYSEPDYLDGSATGGQLTAETSRLSRWHGNIYLRQTRYVLAA